MFNKPHPFIFNRYSVLIPSLLTFLIIVVFRPFSFSGLIDTHLWLLGILFSVVVGLCILISVTLLKVFFPQWTSDENWTTGKEIALIVTVLILISLSIYSLLLFWGLTKTVSVFAYIKLLGITLLIGLFPIVFLVMFEQNRYQQKQLKEAQKLMELIQVQNDVKDSTVELIVFEAENGNPELQLHPNAIRYIKSDGNYCDIFYFLDGKLEKKLLRNRLKYFQEKLPESSFFHCHKSYIVSLSHIMQIEGNARSLELTLNQVEEKIPVSRSKNEQLKLRLKVS